MCEPPESTVFTGDNEESGGQIFSLKTIPWLPSFPSVGTNSERRSRWVTTPGCRRDPPSMTKRSLAVQFFCHSFAIPVSSAVLRIKTEQAHEQEYEFALCIRVHSWLKQKLVLTYFSGFR